MIHVVCSRRHQALPVHSDQRWQDPDLERPCPSGYETLLNEARAISLHAEVWFGSDRPPEERGIRVLDSSWHRVCQVAVGCHRGRSPVVASDPSSAGPAVSVASTVVLRFVSFAYGYVILTTRKFSHVSMTFTLGSVSPRCWGNSKTLSHRSSPTWGLGLRSAHRSARAAFWGVGQIACTLSAKSRRHMPAPCWTPSKALQPLLFTSRLPCHVVSSWPR